MELLTKYQLQPHTIPPNSISTISNFFTLHEGHWKIRPGLELLKYFYSVKETVARGGLLANYGASLSRSTHTENIQH
jgi:hypothetical protein